MADIGNMLSYVMGVQRRGNPSPEERALVQASRGLPVDISGKPSLLGEVFKGDLPKAPMVQQAAQPMPQPIPQQVAQPEPQPEPIDTQPMLPVNEPVPFAPMGSQEQQLVMMLKGRGMSEQEARNKVREL